MQFALSTAFLTLSGLVGLVVSETHTVRFNNRCEDGIPQLIVDGTRVSEGEPFTSDGPILSAVAYLQTDPLTYCWFEGNNCTVVKTTLQNGEPGSETFISIDPPYKFSVPASFRYYDECDGAGATCADEDCEGNNRVVRCTEDNVNLDITFCF